MFIEITPAVRVCVRACLCACLKCVRACVCFKPASLGFVCDSYVFCIYFPPPYARVARILKMVDK